MSSQLEPALPDYKGPCIANVVPELLAGVAGKKTVDWIPRATVGARQVVLLVLDGLGWEQLQERKAMAPTLTSFEGGPISAVVPSTTTAGLTSIVTGRPPSVHGVVGYRMSVGEHGVINLLRWATDEYADARQLIDPVKFQEEPAFRGQRVPAVVESRHATTGFAIAHLRGAKSVNYSVPSSLPVEVWRLAAAGEPFIYAYYAGIDTVAHARGLGEHYDAELYTVDRMIRDLMAGLPAETALVITSDHGQVEVGNRLLDIDPDVLALCSRVSGEGRFRWLHAAHKKEDDLYDLCQSRYGGLAWVVKRDEMSKRGWFGGKLDKRVSSRLGDVALVPFEALAFRDPSQAGERDMACRHGSVTPAEMRVPLLAARVSKGS